MPDLSDLSHEQMRQPLSRATTLPARWYIDPAILAHEKERIFYRTWQWVGSTALVQRPGDFFTYDLYGEPLVMARGQDGVLRGFFNVCLHRAGCVAVGKGNRKIIVPIDHERTLTIFEWYFHQPGSGPGWESMQQSIAFSDEVQREDMELCNMVQRNLRSRTYDRGRFSVKRENGVHHFQSLVAEFLAG